jgi:hypothetical protein
MMIRFVKTPLITIPVKPGPVEKVIPSSPPVFSLTALHQFWIIERVKIFNELIFPIRLILRVKKKFKHLVNTVKIFLFSRDKISRLKTANCPVVHSSWIISGTVIAPPAHNWVKRNIIRYDQRL